MSAALPASGSEFTFRDLCLSEPLLETLAAAGYSTPTAIQAGSIPLLLEGRDVLGQAQTGTGKTAAFALPILQQIDLGKKSPQALVLAPTRELAIQVAKAFETYSARLGGLRVAAIYGGQDYQVQFRQLDRGVHVIVGTPGRVMDHLRRGSLALDGLRWLVLDEADEMLKMGFADDVEWILSQAPAARQTALFSATLPAPIRRIAQQHLANPAEVTVRQAAATADTVRQRYVIAAPRDKQPALARILEAEATDGVIVFVKTKIISEPLAEYLESHGYRAAALNGDLSQKQRERIVEAFRAGKLDVLVATDVAARGLDVQRVSHVINYDLPFDSESYVHRIGRTGRAGRSGEAILFVHPRERRLLKRLEQATRQPIEPMDVPSNRAINKRRVARFHERISAALEHPDLGQFASLIEQFQRERGAPLEQIAAALAAMAQGDKPLLMTEPWKPANFADSRRTEGTAASRPDGHSKFAPGRRGDRPSSRLESFRIEVGHAHQVKPGNIVGAIAGETGLSSAMIGRIAIFDDHSIVDLPAGMPGELFQTLKKVWVAGRQLNISRLSGGRPSVDDRPKRPFAKKGRKPQKKQAIAHA